VYITLCRFTIIKVFVVCDLVITKRTSGLVALQPVQCIDCTAYLKPTFKGVVVYDVYIACDGPVLDLCV